ncbi:hypothetical protein PG993_012378 [Apiospora rasikravindrae]|uniref:Uncharacterized protein n=1 Tax=Apiospora rasikravindrae TaxID=990691 RepID=A0ABR1S286_9PEZI
MADPLHPTTNLPAGAGRLDVLNTSQPDREIPPMRCCCGDLECSVLRHNSTVLDSVEKDVHLAASVGQALLERHEAYMADAKRDRLELTSRIEQLEMDNRELEAKNAQYIESNRDLLDQLESLNSTVADSEGRIRSLEATLLSSQQAIRRLEGETLRAESLERELAFLEQEQADLQSNLAATHEEARSAMSRWKRAERGIVNLQDQLERMENEAKMERERHAEMVGRMEKQCEVEKELNTAAGRLKGAAAIRSFSAANNGSNVVSHFVRDLLQDNSNLQQGIVELREMLMNSNDEIQSLREQMICHQPMESEDVDAPQTLRAELESQESSKTQTSLVSQEHTSMVNQELHIHHHYHVPPGAKQEKKPRKKRQGLTPGIFIPPTHSSGTETPPSAWRPTQVTRTQRDSKHSHRWSIQSEQPSEFALSSAPSSPISNPRNSLFDPIMIESLPTSPTTSVDPMSPKWRSHHKNPSNVSMRSFQVPTNFSLDATQPSQTHTIYEEGDDGQEIAGPMIPTDQYGIEDESGSKYGDPYSDETTDDGRSIRNRVHRAMSHESILSLSGGLDIHTLKSRPSQMTLRPISSVTSVTASCCVVARPMLSRDTAKRSSLVLRDNYASSPSTSSLRAVSGPLPASQRSGPSKLGKWAGSWMPWKGGAASASTSTITATATATPTKPEPESSGDLQHKASGRPPGVNQAGAIPGFHAYWSAHQKRTPSKVQPEAVDRDALREGLTG